jgi:hypothetical protein
MPNRSKLEAKARRNPGGLRLEEVVRLAEADGFEVTCTTRGHYVVTHPELPYTVGLAEPHGRGERRIKSAYVRKLLSAIDEVRALKQRPDALDQAADDAAEE